MRQRISIATCFFFGLGMSLFETSLAEHEIWLQYFQWGCLDEKRTWYSQAGHSQSLGTYLGSLVSEGIQNEFELLVSLFFLGFLD